MSNTTGNVSASRWLDVECGGGSGSPTAKMVNHVKGHTGGISKFGSYHMDDSRKKSVPLKKHKSFNGNNNLLRDSSLNNNSDALSAAGKSKPPSRKASMEMGLIGLLGGSTTRLQRQPSEPSDSYVLQICDTKLTITDAGEGLSTQEMACLLNPYGTIRPESHDVEEQGTTIQYYSNDENTDTSSSSSYPTFPLTASPNTPSYVPSNLTANIRLEFILPSHTNTPHPLLAHTPYTPSRCTPSLHTPSLPSHYDRS